MTRLAGAGFVFLLLGSYAASGSAQAVATLRGTVYDSVHSTPLSDARVLAITTAANGSPQVSEGTTDAHGAFEILSLSPGAYTISVESAALDSAGLSIPDRAQTLGGGSVTDISLATPSRATRIRLACGGPMTDTTLGAIVGVVRDAATGRPVPRARLVLQWSDFRVDSSAHYRTQSKIASVVADSNGAYRACGVPAERSVFVQAQLGPRNTGIVQDRINESGVLVRDFSLVIDSTAVDRGRVSVLVIDAAGHPVPNAQVVLVGTTRRVDGGSDGRARIDSVPSGTQQFEVIAVGYYPVRQTVDVATGSPRALTVSMEQLAVVLDSMRIVASANPNNPRYREFEQRRKQGWGAFYTASDISKRNIFDLSDFFMVLPHLNAHVTSDGHHYFTTQQFHGISTIMPRTQPLRPVPSGAFGDTMPIRQPPSPIAGIGGSTGSGCQPVIVIDGNPVPSNEANSVLEATPPGAVHGIEVYGEGEPVPAQYRQFSGGNCGAIIIWTKWAGR